MKTQILKATGRALTPLLLIAAGGFGGYGLYATRLYSPQVTTSDVLVMNQLANLATKDAEGKPVSTKLAGVGSARAAHTVEGTFIEKGAEDGAQERTKRILTIYDDRDQYVATVQLPG